MFSDLVSLGRSYAVVSLNLFLLKYLSQVFSAFSHCVSLNKSLETDSNKIANILIRALFFFLYYYLNIQGYRYKAVIKIFRIKA